jgi:hypothetical protein
MQNHKIVKFLIIIAMFVLTPFAQAAFLHFDNGDPGDNLWTTQGNWVEDTVPTASDTAYIDTANEHCLIDSTVTNALCVLIKCGQNGGPGFLDITGGKVTATSSSYVGSNTVNGGTVTISGGEWCQTSGSINMGTVSSGAAVGNATIIMTGGTIDLNGVFYTAKGTFDANNSPIHFLDLEAGTIYCDDFNMPSAACVVDINQGSIITEGDDSTELQQYIDNGWITSYDSTNPRAFYLYYDSQADTTTLRSATEQERAIAYNPYPANGAENIDTNSVTLYWTPGDWAADTAGHDIYIGTDYNDVNDATLISDEYIGTVDANSYSPAFFKVGNTYYWRIDEVNDTDTWKGQTWTFTIPYPDVVLETANIKLTIEGSGAVWNSIQDKTYDPNKELCYSSADVKFAQITIDGTDIDPTSIVAEGDTLELTFDNDGNTIIITYDVNTAEDPNWIHFELTDIDGTRPDSMILCQTPVDIIEYVGPTLGAAWDANSTVGIADTNFQCTCTAYSQGGLYALPQAETQDSPGPALEGASAAIIVVDTDQFTGVMNDLAGTYSLLENEDANGTTSKDLFGQESYWFFTGDVNYTSTQEVIDYCNKTNIRKVMLVYSCWADTVGEFDYDTTNWPGGKTSLITFVDALDANGISCGAHTFVSKFSKYSKYVTPTLDPRFWNDKDVVTLTSGIDSSVTTVPVTGDISTWPYGSNSTKTWIGTEAQNAEFYIDNEIFSYTDINETDNAFVGCTRGKWLTTATSHSADANIYHPVTEEGGRYVIDTESDLLDEMCTTMAAVIDDCNFKMVYFDGSEDVRKDRYAYYQSLAHATCMELVTKKPITHQGGLAQHRLWHSFTQGGTVDVWLHTVKRDIDNGDGPDEWTTVKDHINTSVSKVLLRTAEMMPSELGWFGIWAEFSYGGYDLDGLQLDEIEYLMVKSLAYDAKISLETRKAQMDPHLLTDEILEIVGIYENLRQNDLVAGAAKTEMQELNKDWAYIQIADSNEFVQVTQIDEIDGDDEIRSFIGTMDSGDTAATIWHYAGESVTKEIPVTIGDMNAFDLDGNSVSITISDSKYQVPVGATRLTLVFYDSALSMVTNAISTGNLRLDDPGSDSGADPTTAWFNFDESTGTVAYDDTSTSDANLINFAAGDAHWTTGRFGNALQFDGTDDYAYAPSISLPTDVFTIAFWFKPDAAISTTTARQDYMCIGGDRPYICTNKSADGKIGFCGRLYNISDPNIITLTEAESSTASWDADSWHFVAFVYDGNSIKIYVDGDLDKSYSYPNTYHQSVTGMYMGRKISSGSASDGAIDDFRIYDRAMTATQLATIASLDEALASSPSPTNAQQNVDPSVLLTWEPGDYAASHDIYLSTDYSEVANANTGSSAYLTTVTGSNSYDPNLDYGTTYYWAVDEVDGSDLWEGYIWSFNTKLVIASEPQPADDTPGVDLDVVLDWVAGLDANSHDVYLGTDYNTVAAATHASDEYMGNVEVNSYDPATLNPATTYYWAVDEINDTNLWAGYIWAFKTYLDANAPGWWDCDTLYNSGSDSRSGDLTAQGDVAVTTDAAKGSVLTFDGTEPYDHATHSVSLPQQQGTITHWLKADQSRRMVAVYESDGTTANHNGYGGTDVLEIHTGIESDGSWNFWYDDESSYLSNNVSGGTVTTGAWTHVAATWDRAGDIKLYVDGSEVNSLDISGTTFLNGTPTVHQIGSVGNGTTTRFWDGMIEDVRIYDYVLNASQVKVVAGIATELLADDFENDFSKWTDGGTTDWDLATTQCVTSTHSAYCGKNDTTLTSDNLDTSASSSITIRFYYRDDDIDDNDDVYLQLYDGTSYDNKYELGLSTEDTWNLYEVTINNTGDDTQYFHSNFRIRIDGSSIDNGENLWIDDVLIIEE